ncbi:MAG: hypothetical protein ACREIA_01435, partial [Opitutaceae bacterium]
RDRRGGCGEVLFARVFPMIFRLARPRHIPVSVLLLLAACAPVRAASVEKMELPDDNLPDKPLKRFVLGFVGIGFVVFVAIALHSRTPEEVLSEASAAAIVCGLLAGILAAFGKKMLRRILTFAGEIISNP